jgi:hypothetical protein
VGADGQERGHFTGACAAPQQDIHDRVAALARLTFAAAQMWITVCPEVGRLPAATEYWDRECQRYQLLAALGPRACTQLRLSAELCGWSQNGSKTFATWGLAAGCGMSFRRQERRAAAAATVVCNSAIFLPGWSLGVYIPACGVCHGSCGGSSMTVALLGPTWPYQGSRKHKKQHLRQWTPVVATLPTRHVPWRCSWPWTLS